MQGSAWVALRNPDEKFLMARRRDSGAWAFFGGRLHEGEDVENGARRELEEESALSVSGFRSHFACAVGSRTHHIFVAEIPPESVPVLDREHDKARWMTVKEMRKKRLHPVVRIWLRNERP